MRWPCRSLSCALLPALLAPAGEATPDLALPTEAQARWQDLELGIFLHFGINTFHGVEWSDGSLDPATFDPKELDAGQWARAARAAGARYVVLTAKHHDGFCLWPTSTTRYSVRSSPWKGGRGDVVREAADACRREGIGFGIYLSPWDRHEPSYRDPKAYDDFYARQMEELLTGYGPLVEVWLDGAGSEGRTYDWERIVALIKKHQGEAMIFNMGAPTIRWSGNERGFAPEPCWNTVRAEDVLKFASGKVVSDGSGSVWLPVECDVPLRGGWFWKRGSERTTKPLAELLAVYYRSVGRGANLLLNVAPDDRGLLPASDLARLDELAGEVRRRFGKSVASTSGSGATLELDLGGERRVDHVVLAEDIRRGERVGSHVVEVLAQGRWREAARGTAIGHKRIHALVPVRAEKLRLRVLDRREPPIIRDFSAFDAVREQAEDRLDEALLDLDLALALDETRTATFHERAGVLFKLRRFREALRDYDLAAAGGRPHDESSCWERGLARYYLGDFDGGRKQFEGYHRFDALDIENGLWRFLCIAEREGIEEARGTLLPYPRKVRPPFPALWRLYSGSGSPEEVLREAVLGVEAEAQRSEGSFYAHYYIAKHFEAWRDRERALAHLKLALAHRVSHFMYDCARIDLERLSTRAPAPFDR